MQLSPGALWSTLLIIGFGTFLIRFSFFWLFRRGKVRPEVERILRFVPPAVLSALIIPGLIFPRGAANFSFLEERFLGGLVAAAVAWRTGNVLLTISSGMISLWLLLFLKSSF